MTASRGAPLTRWSLFHVKHPLLRKARLSGSMPDRAGGFERLSRPVEALTPERSARRSPEAARMFHVKHRVDASIEGCPGTSRGGGQQRRPRAPSPRQVGAHRSAVDALAADALWRLQLRSRHAGAFHVKSRRATATPGPVRRQWAGSTSPGMRPVTLSLREAVGEGPVTSRGCAATGPAEVPNGPAPSGSLGHDCDAGSNSCRRRAHPRESQDLPTSFPALARPRRHSSKSAGRPACGQAGWPAVEEGDHASTPDESHAVEGGTRWATPGGPSEVHPIPTELAHPG